MKVYCPECETACSEQAPFCPKCGHPLQEPQQIPTPPPKTKSSLAGVFKLIVALTFGGIVLVCAGICTSAFDTVDKSPPSTAGTSRAPVKHELQPLHIEVLKAYMASRSHGAIDIRFTNTSDIFLNHWAVSIEVYGDNDSYLGANTVMVSMLNPGATKIEQLMLLDINVARIKRWEARLDGVVGRSGLRIDDQFELKAE